MNGIAQQLRQAIRDSKLSQQAIAKLAGIRPNTVSDFMNDKHEGQIGTAEDMAEALGMEWKLVPKSK